MTKDSSSVPGGVGSDAALGSCKTSQARSDIAATPDSMLQAMCDKGLDFFEEGDIVKMLQESNSLMTVLDGLPRDSVPIAAFKQAFLRCHAIINTIANVATPPPGEQIVVFDVLSDREEAQHQALWPAFLAAKVAGKRQFHRARLVVDGERVPAPAC
ncbi:hypothetical protein FOA52_003369 [Chlamydomonas sp. UWO 241]|nr:hypothetical protein FOA52_003369 [Chlamydomonas sp. UWO 241]